MTGDRIAQALARIEAAASRIETAASRPAPLRAAGDTEIVHRYETLRREAGAALAELDRVLGSLEP